MRYSIIFLIVILSRYHANAQHLPQRYLQDKFLDFKMSYSTQTPEINERYLVFELTYLKNHLFVDDGINEPSIGLSLNPTLGYSASYNDLSEINATLLQNGIFSFIPNLFFRIKAEPKQTSQFEFFGNIGGGVKYFPKLTSRSTPDSVKVEKGLRGFEQWVFNTGGGIDFDGKITVSAQYFFGWHDLISSTRTYFKQTISKSTTVEGYSLHFSARILSIKIGELYFNFSGYKHLRSAFGKESILLL